MSKQRNQPKNDDELKAHWASITDPVDMLNAIVQYSWVLGGDPYYSDLVTALVSNAERVAELNKPGAAPAS